MPLINGVDYGYLSDVQEQMCDAVDAYRDNILNDKFMWNNSQWNCDPVSRANINGACTIAILNGGNLPAGFVWRDFVNINHPVTATDMGNMAAACATFTFATYQNAWTHKANILAITDPNNILDVINYDYATGWPNVSITFAVTGVPTSTEFQVSTDITSVLTILPYFTITGSASNDGAYTVSSSSYDSTSNTTTITTNETIPSLTADGNVVVS